MNGRRAGREGFALLFIGLTVASAGSAEETKRVAARSEHLLQAALHLERAGQLDLAAGIYAQLNAEPQTDRQRLVEARRERIRQLELEIARLQDASVTAAPSAGQVVIEVQLVALSWAKLRQSGLGLVSLRSLVESPESTAILDEQGQIAEFVELLCKEELAQVLSRPRLVTLDGQSASAEISQDPQTLPAGSRTKLRIQCTPQLLAGERLRLDVACRVQSTAADKVPNTDSGPVDRTQEVKAQLELQSGQTMILAGPRGSAGDAESLLVLLTARFQGISSQATPP